jgi:hypothetical protein
MSSSEVALDHLTVLAGPYGLEVGKDCERTTITNCAFDGGLPLWSFSSDGKNGYTMVGGEKNGLAERTIRTLAYCHASSSTTTFENCEFTNAHDFLLNGPDTVFRHNWSTTSTTTASSSVGPRRTYVSRATSSISV